MAVTHTITGGLVHLSGNKIEVVVTTDQNMPNQRLCLRVTCDKLFGSPFDPEEIAPKNGVAKFDISGLVDQNVKYSFDYPSTQVMTIHEALAFDVKVEVGLVYTENDTRVETWEAASTIIRVLKGRLRPYELTKFNEFGKTFASEYIEKGRFLTHLPNNQVVDLKQDIKLWYLSRWTVQKELTYHYEVDLQYIDDESMLTLEMSDTLQIDPSALIEFSLSPGPCGFLGYYYSQNYDPEHQRPFNILRYSFWLTDGEEVVSERRYFNIDEKYHKNVFYFYYVNPLSGIDSIRATGSYREKVKTESEVAYLPLETGSDTKVASLATLTASGQRAWDINMGIKSKAEQKQLRDFLEAKERWMADPDIKWDQKEYWMTDPFVDYDKRLIPIYIEAEEFTLVESMKDTQSITIQVLEAHK